MRRLVYYVAASVDGFIAHPGGTWEGFVGEGTHADEYLVALRSYSAAVMGRATYEIAPRMGVVDPYPFLETFVFSTSMADVDCPNVQVVREDAAAFVAAMKQRPAASGSVAPIYLAGGGAFAGSMLAADLIDEILIKLNPVVLGTGIPITTALPSFVPLELLSTKDYGNGVLLLRYRPTAASKPASTTTS